MDYYKILGLRRDASKEDIKDAFRKLALKFHPDRHVNSSKAVQEDANRRFKEVSAAYDVLGDDKKRAVYSRSGSYYGGSAYGGGYNSQHNAYRGGYNANQGAYWGGGYNSNRGTYRGGGYTAHQGRRSGSYSWTFRFGTPLQNFSRVDFLLHVVFVGVVIGSVYVAEATGEAIWQRRNTGKSFEATIQSLNQTKEEKLVGIQEDMNSKEN